MKATGIVRRIDELGRIVIPKEIRRTQRIRQGDSLEIFTAADGEVVFKKYSPLSGLGSLSKVYAEVLAKSLGRPVVVCDTHQIVAAAGPGRGELLGRAISPELEQLLAARSVYTAPPIGTRPPADAGTQRAADFMRRTDLSTWRHRGRRAAARTGGTPCRRKKPYTLWPRRPPFWPSGWKNNAAPALAVPTAQGGFFYAFLIYIGRPG